MADTIKKLTDLFAKFPTIGSRTANRFVLYLLSLSKEKVDELTSTIEDLRQNIKTCSFCFNHYEPARSATAVAGGDNSPLCPICRDSLRNKEILCVVEKETDLTSIENTKKYRGFYFILEGTVTMRKSNPTDLRITDLITRIQNPVKFGLEKTVFKEVIIATNPTPEGQATSMLVERALKELPSASSIKITHLAKGLPTGGELEYADPETLESAFEGRK